MVLIGGKKRFLLIIAVALLFTAIVVAGYSLRYQQKSEKKEAVSSRSDLCNTDKIGQELRTRFQYFDFSKTREMGQLISDILNESEYDRAENCLYVLGRYYMFTGNMQKALENFKGLLGLNSEVGSWVDEAIGLDQREGVEARVQYLETLSKDDANLVNKGIIPDVRQLE